MDNKYYMRDIKNINGNVYFSSLIFNSIFGHHLLENLKTYIFQGHIHNPIYTIFFTDKRFYSLVRRGNLIPQRIHIKPYIM